MKVNPAGDGSRGPARVIEVLPDCMLTVCVEVVDRKVPLKFYVQYAKKQGIENKIYRSKGSLVRPHTAKVRGPVHDTESYGDLIIYTSQTIKEPNEEHHSQKFVNPCSRVVLRNQVAQDKKDRPGAPRDLMVESDNFVSTHMFISLYSQQGCTVSVSC